MKDYCKSNRYSFLPVILLCLMVMLALLYGCAKGSSSDTLPVQPGNRIIQFAGYDWEVRSNETALQGPGPNYFSDRDQNVWVDHLGRLHLKITQKNGNWYAAGIVLKKVYGYGRYIFQIESPASSLDKNGVGAVFLYKNDNQEIDVELSRWGLENNDNTQYVIQPGDKSGNKKRFNCLEVNKPSVQVIDWQKGQVNFATYKGNIDDTAASGNMIASWHYMGPDIPMDQDLRVRINLWLFKGSEPSNGKDQELIISGFKIQ